ncbi:MAG: carbohydrate ABC transporter permease [Clostridiales bacterium]|nr:carbohydrate ABC transporter permease [Clostridiales bacterium]
MKKKTHMGIHVIMIITSILFVLPFLIIVGSSFQSQNDLISNGYRIIPKEATLASYKAILASPDSLVRSYIITIFTSAVSVVLGTVMSSSCAFVMTRKDYKYRNVLTFIMFVPMLLNGGMVASYINITQFLGLKNSILVLILPGLVSSWYILLMKGFFSSIPYEIIESAKIDGANEFEIFGRIVIPLSKPAVATIALFYLLASWNEWYNSMLYIDDPKLVKLQYLMMRIQSSIEFLNSAEALQYGAVQAGQEVPQAGARMAMCLLAVGPMLVIFPFFQKYFVQGLTVGSVKG